ncbi:MAG TPA: MFS transporter, partial [Candidatus Nanopelagicales bacterium]|nr:MFS transporter [Candidatus Nanopelagicales bacterium]
MSLTVDLTPLKVSRQLRLLLAGRAVSVFGIGMLMVVLTVQTWELTGSSLQVALINTVLGLSAVAGSLLGGVLADRYDRRRVILISRGLAVLGFAALTVNASLPEPSVAVLYVFAVWDGFTGSVGSTAFGAAVPSVVPPRLLPATGALTSLSLDVGSAVAPLVGGLIAGYAGMSWVYVTVTLVSVFSWLFLVRLDPLLPGAADGDQDAQGHDQGQGSDHERDHDHEQGHDHQQDRGGRLRAWWRGFREGLGFVRRERVVGAVILLGFVQIFFASPYVLIPE